MKNALVLLFAAATLSLIAGCSSSDDSSEKSETPKEDASPKQWDAPPEMTIKEDGTYTATLETSEGDIVIELLPKEAPNAVNNFVFLAGEGFFDGVPFHRIIKDFMVQTGDPEGTGMGGPGYTIPDDKVTLDYERGIVAMANTGMPDSGGSQFFIVHGESVGLEKTYAIFGRVTEGLDVLDAIAGTPVEDNGQGELSKPTSDVTLEKVTIEGPE